jgi:hypothetical protein
VPLQAHRCGAPALHLISAQQAAGPASRAGGDGPAPRAGAVELVAAALAQAAGGG